MCLITGNIREDTRESDQVLSYNRWLQASYESKAQADEIVCNGNQVLLLPLS